MYIDGFPGYKLPLSSEIFKPRLSTSTSPKAHEKEESEAGSTTKVDSSHGLGLEIRGKMVNFAEYC